MPRVILVALLCLAGCSPVAPIGANDPAALVTVEPVGITPRGSEKHTSLTYRVTNRSDRSLRVVVNLTAYDLEGDLVAGAMVSAGDVGAGQTVEPTAPLACTGKPATMKVSVATAY